MGKFLVRKAKNSKLRQLIVYAKHIVSLKRRISTMAKDDSLSFQI